MAARQKLDINLYQGDTQGFKYTFYTDVAQTIKYNFSGASLVKMSFKKTLDATSVLFFVTATDLQGGSDFTNGIAVFSVTKENAALLSRDGKYDVQISLASSNVSPVYGDVIVQRQVAP